MECLDTVLQGDFNVDANVDILDIVQLVNAILIGPALSECQVQAMDMNSDNKVNGKPRNLIDELASVISYDKHFDLADYMLSPGRALQYSTLWLS